MHKDNQIKMPPKEQEHIFFACVQAAPLVDLDLKKRKNLTNDTRLSQGWRKQLRPNGFEAGGGFCEVHKDDQIKKPPKEHGHIFCACVQATRLVNLDVQKRKNFTNDTRLSQGQTKHLGPNGFEAGSGFCEVHKDDQIKMPPKEQEQIFFA